MSGFDCVVVGAGTAGCVLAARLSEDPARRVAVLEAGPDARDVASMPEALRRGSAAGDDGDYDWGLSATVCGGRHAPLARGRIVGGSAQVNGSGAWRAPAEDFARWTATGVQGWSWADVVQAYRAIETDVDFGDLEWHGSTGPVPITRFSEEELSAPMAGLLEAVVAAGHTELADMNAPDAVGIGRYPQNRRRDIRMSTNLTHLAPARGRDNLTVRTDVTVDTVEIRDGRAVGVRVGTELVEARMIILAAGTPMTPALLLRSGIGPAADLRALGIPVVADRPGVGSGVYDQPGAVVPARPAPGLSAIGPGPRLVGRLAAIPGHESDDSLYLSLFVNPPPGGSDVMCALMIGDMNQDSRGTIRLSGASPRELPMTDLAFYTARGDLDRMRSAYRHAWAIAQHPAYTRNISEFVMVDDRLVGDDDRLDELLRHMTFSRGALLGGAPMGAPGDAGAVVDDRCRVYGIDGLRIVDLSIVPVALRSPTALDAMAIGEHAARLLTG